MRTKNTLYSKKQEDRMKRMTRSRCSGIKRGYWSPETKEALVQRLAQYENLDPDPEHLRERLERAEGVKLRRE